MFGNDDAGVLTISHRVKGMKIDNGSIILFYFWVFLVCPHSLGFGFPFDLTLTCQEDGVPLPLPPPTLFNLIIPLSPFSIYFPPKLQGTHDKCTQSQAIAVQRPGKLNIGLPYTCMPYPKIGHRTQKCTHYIIGCRRKCMADFAWLHVLPKCPW